MSDVVRLVHYMSVQHNPFKGIGNGINTLDWGRGDIAPGIYCVPESKPSLRHMWCTGQNGHRDLMVILEVPWEHVKCSKMGRIVDLKNVASFAAVCDDPDNAYVIVGEFDPQWIKEVYYCYYSDNKVIEEALDESFWQ